MSHRKVRPTDTRCNRADIIFSVSTCIRCLSKDNYNKTELASFKCRTFVGLQKLPNVIALIGLPNPPEKHALDISTNDKCIITTCNFACFRLRGFNVALALYIGHQQSDKLWSVVYSRPECEFSALTDISCLMERDEIPVNVSETNKQILENELPVKMHVKHSDVVFAVLEVTLVFCVVRVVSVISNSGTDHAFGVSCKRRRCCVARNRRLFTGYYIRSANHHYVGQYL